MVSVARDVRFALRGLGKQPGFTTLAALASDRAASISKRGTAWGARQ